MVIGGFYFLILADHRMTIYLPEGCALAGSENLFIFGEIWGEYWEVAAGCGVGFRQFRLTHFFVSRINLKNISYISY